MSLIYEFTIAPNGSDDTTSIQDAITFLRGSQNGTLFIFQYQTEPYIVSNISIPANFTLIGNGVTIKQKDNTINSPIFILEQAWDTRIEGFNFDGNKSGISKSPSYYSANAISIIDCDNIELDNLTFKDVLLSCIVISTNVNDGCNNIIINNCISKDLGLYYQGNNYLGSFVAVRISNNISICNSTVKNCLGNGILLTYGNNITIDNLIMENVGFIDGISALDCSRLTIQNCLFKDIFSSSIELNGVNEFTIINNVVEYSEGYIGREDTNYGILISYNSDPVNPPNIISSNGLIQNFKGSNYKPSANYQDILVSGSENINMTSCNCPQGMVLSRYGEKPNSIPCSKISILGSSIGSLLILSVTNVLIDLSNCGFLVVADYRFDIFPREIFLRNSTFSDISMFGCQDLQIENSNFTNISNERSSFYCLNNRKGLDLYYEGFPFEGTVIFTLPSVNSPNAPGIYFGTIAIDVSKTTDQYGSFVSDFYYIRSQANGNNWLASAITSIGGPIMVPYYSFNILDNQINIGINSTLMVRLTLKLGFDKV